MSKKSKTQKKKQPQVQMITEEPIEEKSNALILAGVLLAMSSIGLLIYVLNEKVINLGWILKADSRITLLYKIQSSFPRKAKQKKSLITEYSLNIISCKIGYFNS